MVLEPKFQVAGTQLLQSPALEPVRVCSPPPPGSIVNVRIKRLSLGEAGVDGGRGLPGGPILSSRLPRGRHKWCLLFLTIQE